MGSYAECWLATLYVGSTKNDFDDTLMQLFRASDKRMYRSAIKDLPRALVHWTKENPRRKVNVVYYTASALLVKDRLNLKGYTLPTAKRAFMKRMQAESQWYSNHAVPQFKEFYENRARILRELNVEHWIETVKSFKAASRGVPPWGTTKLHQAELTLEDFMLQTEWYGFDGTDLNVPLRLALEICDERDSFIYDLSDLVDARYFDKDDDFVALASDFSASEHASRSKIIILTEGRSDTWILSGAMKLLYPHLSDYFSFMDFEAAKVEGGVSHLARVVKSFAGAGIVNKVIAVFDNDTAGEEAIRSLRRLKLPSNLCILKLPDLKVLCKYPTIGPSGRITMNVNGSAASMELYLGDDVLREGGKLAPVQWSAYNPVMGRYQGEVLEKEKIHRRFKEKLANQKGHTNLIHDPNWSGLCSILSSIFSAFHRYDQKLILTDAVHAP